MWVIMKKRMKIIIFIVLVVLCVIGGIFKVITMLTRNSVTVIGGADGPTTIFIAGKLDNSRDNSKEEIEVVNNFENSTEFENEDNGMSEAEIQEAVYKMYYEPWTDEDMAKAIDNRSSYYQKTSYYNEVTDYLESVQEKSDVSNVVEPLYYTDMKYYKEEDFKDVPPVMIHIAKNEIYARHGYSFKNEDLYNYFMGCIWYVPANNNEELKDSIFNQYEIANLELLTGLDNYNLD